MSKPNADYVRWTDADEMSLGDLIELAHAHELDRYHAWTRWQENYYDPAKSELLDMLIRADVVGDRDEEAAQIDGSGVSDV